MIDYPEFTIIVGSGRSGTSYLQRTLRESMDIGFSIEPRFVIPLYRRLHSFGDLKKPENLRQLALLVNEDRTFKQVNQNNKNKSTPEDILEHAREPTYTGIVYAAFAVLAEKQGLSRLGYKFPGDVTQMPLLAKILPTARFVHIMRDGRDVALSMLRLNWGPTNLYAGCHYWAQKTAIGRKDGALLGDRYFEFRFEDLLLDTESTAYSLGQFINQGQNLDQVNNLVEHVQNTRKPEIAYGWKHKLDKKQCNLCESAAGEVLKDCSYSVEFGGQHANPSFKAAYYLTIDRLYRAGINLKKRLNKRFIRQARTW